MSNGKVYLVGAGPGDPGLLTLKGQRLIGEADVIIYDALVSQRLLNFAKPDSEKIFVGKRGGKASASQKEIESLLLQRAKEGKTVVRLKGGDPFTFGRGGEEALMLAEHKIDWEVVPGVTSAIAAPAYAGIPLTQRTLTSTVSFITGHEDPSKETSSLDWKGIASGKGTLVFLMGISRLSEIIAKLVEQGRPSHTSCAVVMWGTLPCQKTVTGNLSNIILKVKEAGVGSPSIFIVGEVVTLRDQLKWFENSPLFGKRILVTRSREQASVLVETLEKLGADPIEFPSIRIAPVQDWSLVDKALENISKFDWLIFTSVNAVGIFFERLLNQGKDIRDLKGLKIAAIGDMTRKAIEDKFLKVDLSPSEFVAEALLEAFKKEGSLKGKKFLLPRADQARLVLPEGLKKEGADVTEITLYQTLPDTASGNDLMEEIADRPLDWVTFTSSSTVKNFVEGLGSHFEKLKGKFKVASIGPITSQTARNMGLKVDIEAKIHTIPGLVEALVGYHTANKNTNHQISIIK